MSVLAHSTRPTATTGAIALASDLVRIKSYSGDEAEIADFTAKHLKSLGLEVVAQEIGSGRRNVIGYWRGRGGRPSLMYNGHMDTNPAGEGWTRDPLGGDVED